VEYAAMFVESLSFHFIGNNGISGD